MFAFLFTDSRTIVDGASVHSEDVSLDLLCPYPTISSSSATHTAVAVARPPLNKAPVESIQVARTTTSNITQRPVGSTANSTATPGSAGSSSWDLFGLPAPLVMLPPTKKYAGKAASRTSNTTNTATARSKQLPSAGTGHTSAITKSAATKPAPAAPVAPAARVVGDKRKYTNLATATSETAGTVGRTSTNSTAPAHRAPPPATAERPPQAKSKPIVTSSSTATVKTNTTAPASVRTTNTFSNKPNSTTAPAAKKKQIYVSEDWFDEDAPF